MLSISGTGNGESTESADIGGEEVKRRGRYGQLGPLTLHTGTDQRTKTQSTTEPPVCLLSSLALCSPGAYL